MEFKGTSEAWELTLSHDEELSLSHDEAVTADRIAYLLAHGVPSPITAALCLGTSCLRFVDATAGNNGVAIAGSDSNHIITPSRIPIVSGATNSLKII